MEWDKDYQRRRNWRRNVAKVKMERWKEDETDGRGQGEGGVVERN